LSSLPTRPLISIFLSVLVCGFVVASPLWSDAVARSVARTEPFRNIRIQLKWTHQFQFAGLYAAIDQGYFASSGIKVDLLEGGPTIDPAGAVTDGNAEFGIGNGSLLVMRANGMPLVAVAPIFQHTPFVIIARRDGKITRPKDLEGHTLMLESHAEELLAYLTLQGVDLGKVYMIPHSGDVRDLISGHADAMSAYVTTEPFDLIMQKIPYQEFNQRLAGIDMYGDTLFTSDTLANEEPELVRAVRDAMIRGWKHALKNPNSVIDLIIDSYAPTIDPRFLDFEVEQIRRLMATDLVSIGYMNRDRWSRNADVFIKAGLIKKGFDVDAFLFDEKGPQQDLSSIYLALAAMIVVTIITATLAWRFHRLNLNLKNSEARLTYEVDVKNKFFSIIAHDLKSPFHSLLGMTHAMSKMADSFSKDKLVEYATNVNDAGNTVFSLLQNLLEWSRVQMEGGEFEPQMISLRDLTQECIGILNPAALEKGIALTNLIKNDTAFADREMALTVIRNLITNSLNFTPSGGKVEVSSTSQGKMVQVTVSDTGVGISIEQEEKVFALDQKTSTVGTAGEKGTGLGLPLCKDLLERNGGRIWVESTPGKGSCFHFTLPIEPGKS
jgi:signal transduction histidine kinase